MVQIPDSIRPYAFALRKFHFWILALLAPLVLLPLLFTAEAGIAEKIEAQRNKIKSSDESIKAVLGKRPHPNEKWAEQIGRRAREINDETLEVWEQLWKVQAPLRKWPEVLGPDFVEAASSLPPEGVLKRSLCERYRNEIRQVPRELPSRMGVDDLMTDTAVNVEARQNEPVRPEKKASLAEWSQADQRRLFDSFNWEQLPSTTQVMMAQEELWMYGVMCDVIQKVNSVPVGEDPQAVMTPANIPIPFVRELKVGYLAAEDDPGGRASQRILRVRQPDSNASDSNRFGEAMPSPDGTTNSTAGRPAHPRFGGGQGGSRDSRPSDAGGESEPEGGISADEALKGWVYVDLEGKPLTASQLAAAPTSKILRLMPFILRTTIDQRALDRLLIELASGPVPIDTRQVRINADGSSGRDSGGRGPARGGRSPRVNSPSGADDRGETGGRIYDVSLELRGTLTIVMPPNPSLLKVGERDNQGEDSE